METKFIKEKQVEKVIKMNMNTTLKQQLKKHQDDKVREANIKTLEERLNTLLSNEKIKDCIKKSLSLGFSACYDNEELFALLSPYKSSEVMTFNDVYEFSIFCTKEQAEKEKKLYRLHAFISTQSNTLKVKVLTFLEDDISESDVLNCLIELVGYEFHDNSATLVELLEQETIEKEARKTFVRELSNLINTEKIKKILVEAAKSQKSFVASTISDGYNIVLQKNTAGCFLFYIAQLGDNDLKQEILSTSVSIVSIQFTLVQNKNKKSDTLCDFELEEKFTDLFHYIPEKISCNKILDYFKKVVGTM